jgi:hypothetical protein
MLVTYSLNDTRLVFSFECEEGEPKRASPKFASSTFFVDLQGMTSLENIHPDHLALSAVLVTRPWLNGTIRFSIPISQKFADALAENKIQASPVNRDLKPYSASDDGYMGLAFSGGADSTAALSVLPSTTIPIFLNRPKVAEVSTMYAKDAALHACKQLRRIGYRCLMIDCDLEYVREPVGFPTDLANGVPALLLAKHLNLYSLSFGTVLESLYGLGRLKFKDYASTSHNKMWWSIFESAGIPLSFPVGGVSEVGTELICSKSGLGTVAQSCIRGRISKPCLHCWKCFRKSTVRVALGLMYASEFDLKHLLSSKEVVNKLAGLPISHENVLMYSFSKIDQSVFHSDFYDRFGTNEDLSYLTMIYSPALNYVHERARDDVKNNLAQFLNSMEPEHELQVKEWDNAERISKRVPLAVTVKNANP